MQTTKEKRFAVFHLARTPYTGVWSVIRNLALYQTQIGYSVAVGILTYPHWTKQYSKALIDLEKAGITVFTAPIPKLPYTLLFPYLVAYWQVMKHPWEQWIDEFCHQRNLSQCVVHCHNAWLSGAYLPYRGKKTVDVKFVATYHGIAGAPTLRRSKWRRIIHKWLAQRFVQYGGKLASVDKENIQVAEELFKLRADMFQVIPNGVPPIQPLPSPPFPTDKPSIGHVGTLNEGKGWRITAEAVRIANERGIECRFVAAGGGPEAQDVQNWCAAHPSIANYLGQVENAGEIVTPHLTLFALPSQAEGSPMAAIEAIAAGVPVIGTAVSGLGEIIENGRSGLTVTRRVDVLADAICTVLSTPEQLAILRCGAQEVFTERFHIARCTAAYDALYTNALLS